jgi:hypothetical protein
MVYCNSLMSKVISNVFYEYNVGDNKIRLVNKQLQAVEKSIVARGGSFYKD